MNEEENSREEDIKDLKKYISFSKKHENFSHDADWKWHKEIGEKIERVLKELEEKTTILLAGAEKVKQLEKENEELKNKYATFVKMSCEIVEQSILDQGVKDKIEELEEQYKIALEENSTKAFILKCQITILQELLEGRK